MKKEIYIGIICALVILSIVIAPLGYFVGKGEREILASECGDVVCPEWPTDWPIVICPECPEIPPCPEIPKCPQCPDVNITYPEDDDCRAWTDLSAPEDYTVWTFDNDTKILNITYYDNWYDIHRNLTFYNWTEVIDWLRFYGVVPDMISARQSIVLMFLAASWGYAETTGNWP